MANQHYEKNLRAKQIIQQLQQAYPNGADKYQLAPIDQLHIGGIRASQKLIQHLSDGDLVLELGSGLGGVMRLAQEQKKLQVFGLDISHGFNRLSRELSQISTTKTPTIAITGDAHYLPFSDNAFDKVIMQHSLLNMPNPLLVLKACYRVLKPGGQLILHEVIEGENVNALTFPVPWAEIEDDSHLMQEAQILELLVATGFQLNALTDWSEEAIEWRKRQASKEQKSVKIKPVVSPDMIFGDQFQVMAVNVMRNLSEGAIRVVELVISKPTASNEQNTEVAYRKQEPCGV